MAGRRTKSRRQKHRQIRLPRAYRVGQRRPVHTSGHHDVANHEIEILVFNNFQRSQSARYCVNLITELLEH